MDASSSSSSTKPKKKIDAKAAAAKRKAREQRERLAQGGGGSSFPWLLFLANVAMAIVAYKVCKPVHRPLDRASITARRVTLRDGRQMAVHEMGADARSARFHVLVLHDLRGCRLSMLPNITREWLVWKGIRLVSYDRPGYGQSDPHELRNATTVAKDLDWALENIGLTEQRFYVLSVGAGSYVAWTILNRFPEKTKAVAMVSPWGSFRMESMEAEELLEAWQLMPRRLRVPLLTARLGPWGLSVLEKVTGLLGPVPNRNLPDWAGSENPVPEWVEEYLNYTTVETLRTVLAVAGVARRAELGPSPEDIAARDLAVVQSEPVAKYLKEMEAEALRQGESESVHRDLTAIAGKWGFDINDNNITIKASDIVLSKKVFVDLWYGRSDSVAPPVFSKYAERVVDDLKLHEMVGGHYFWHEDQKWPKLILEDLIRPRSTEAQASG